MAIEEQIALQDLCAYHLNTHDKRWMFLKIFFPQFVSHIALEGSAINTAFNILQFMKSRNSLEKFEEILKEIFG